MQRAKRRLSQSSEFIWLWVKTYGAFLEMVTTPRLSFLKAFWVFTGAPGFGPIGLHEVLAELLDIHAVPDNGWP